MVAPGVAAELPLDRIALPAGFAIEVVTDRVANARQMALGDAGTLFVGSREEARRVYAVVDRNGDWRAEAVHVVAADLDLPSGVAFKGRDLYIAANSRILRLDGIEARLVDPPSAVVVADDLPSERYHGWRYIKFGPDGLLYVPIGLPCDACQRGAPFGRIMRTDSEGIDRQIHVSGIRSVQGLAWHPATGELWFADNGRNHLGDDLPPDEINRVERTGQNFGAPYCHGGTIADPDIVGATCEGSSPPAATLPAHVSPLGIAFYDGGQFPDSYKDRLFIAEHGSWDRSVPVGYRITTTTFGADHTPVAYEVFAEGWLGADGEPWGRPTDLLVAPDGSLLVSDDHAGAIYQIRYAGATGG